MVTRLTWSVSGATGIMVDSVGDTSGQDLNNVTGQTFLYVAPRQNTTYTLTASTASNSVSQQVTVTVTDTPPPQFGTGTTYYVSPAGNDGNNGLSAAAPWQTVAKVNGRTFNPGDIILFQRGGEWHESLIAPSDGAAGNPITFADYGTGAKPKFWGSVVLNNASFQSLGGGVYSYTIATPVLSALVNHTFFYYNASNNAATLSNSWSYSGTTLLINSNSNPAIDGKVYTAVVRQDVVFSNFHSHLIFRNLVVDESAAYNGGYAFRIENSTDVLVDSCEAYRAGKHHYGAINSTQFVGKNLYAAWAMPGQGYGGADAYVTYGDATEVPLLPNQTSVWQNCVFDHPQDPQEGFNYYTLYTHGPNVTSVTVTNMSSLGGNFAVNNGENLNETVTITGGLIQNARMEVFGQKSVVDGMHITGPYGEIVMYGSYLTFQNLLLEGSYLEPDGYASAIVSWGNGNTVRFSTIIVDPRAAANYSCAVLDNNSSSQPVGGAFFNFYGNICISPTTNLKQWDAGTALSSDIASSEFNLYGPGTGFCQLKNDNSCNFVNLTQWKALGVDAGSISGTPLFQNQPNGNYSLLQGSPGIDVAALPSSVLTAIPPVPVDYAGNPRLQGAAFDTGAVESPYTVLGGVTIGVTPSTDTLGASQTLQLAATVSGSSYQQFNWSVTSGPGSITASGLYTAPLTVSSQQTAIVAATSVTFPSVSGTSTITLTPISVSVSPQNLTLFEGQLQQFSPTVTGTGNSGVTWKVLSGPGTISATGLYTAPNPVATPQTVVIQATSTQDPTKFGNSSNTVTAGSPSNGASVASFGAVGDGIMRTDGAMNAGSAALTSPTGSFSQNDVGKYVQVIGAGPGGTSHTDGSMQAGATLLVSNSASFASTDTGRGIAIAGAGINGGMLVSSIASVVSATSVKLNAPAVSTVSNVGYFYGAMTLEGTIQSFQSATSVTLSAPAAATITGAVYVYGTDNHAAFQSALDSVGQAGGGTVTVPQPASCPAGATCGYVINTTDQMTSVVPGAVKIRYSNITLTGVTPQTNLFCRGAWATYANSAKFPGQTATIRGHCVAIGDNGGPNGVAGESVSNIAIANLHLYGMSNGNTYSVSFNPAAPPLTTTGDGWDYTHKAIYMFEGGAFSNITIDSVVIQDFKGETIFSGGSVVNGLVISNSSISNFNGDGISVLAAGLQVVNNTITNGSNAGIEDAVYGGTSKALVSHLFQSNTISQMAGEAIAVNGDDLIPETGSIQIIGNYFDTIGQPASSLAKTAIYVTPLVGGNATPANVTITGNTCHDCFSFGILQTEGTTLISNNTFIVDKYNAYNFLSFTFPQTNVTVQNNTGYFTAAATTNGITLHAVYEINPGYMTGNFNWTNVLIGANTWNFPGTPNYEFVTTSGLLWALLTNKNIIWQDDTCAGCTYADVNHGLVSLAATSLIEPYGPVVVVNGNAGAVAATVDAGKEQDGSLVQIVNGGNQNVTFSSDANLSLASPVTLAAGASVTLRFSGAIGKFTQAQAQAAAPLFSLPPGPYTGSQSVSLTTATVGASIRYTTNGVTQPTETVGTLYAGGTIPLNSTTTILAIAYKAGLLDSTVSSGTYTITQAAGAVLGTSSLVVPAGAGANSVELVTAANWTANTAAPWLHLPTSSGAGGAIVTFTYDANPGATRTGTITFNNNFALTLTITQAGASYIPAAYLTTLVSSGLSLPEGVAVDGAGNLYIADSAANTIYKWTASTQQLSAVTSSGLSGPNQLAIDSSGNIFLSDFYNNALKEWNATTQLVTVLASGLNLPHGVALDSAGNVYVADVFNNAVKEWNATTKQVTTVVSGLNLPHGVVLDALGNLYIGDTNNNAVKAWSPVTHQVTTLVSSGLSLNEGVAVDGSGNVYISDGNHAAIKQWSPSTQQVTTLLSTGLTYPDALALDALGNIYIADPDGAAVRKLTRAFVGPSSMTEAAPAGVDALLQVLPSGTPVSAVSDQSWLTIGAITNGVVSFSFTANANGTARVAHITVLGQQITVTQSTGTPASIAPNAGVTPQSAAINVGFVTPLAVTVRDSSNNPVAGVNVIFTAPGAGASGKFGNNTATITVPTDGTGTAAAAFTANGTTGANYTVTATAGAFSTNLVLTNLATAPATITPVAGATPQSTTITNGFAIALGVVVQDSSHNPLQGVDVVFSAPGSGATGTFSNNTATIIVATDSSGTASAPFTANATAGSNYLVTAATSALSTGFTLTNLTGPPTKLSTNSGTTPQSATVNTAFANALAVTVTDTGNNPLSGVNVTFTAPASGASGKFSNTTQTIIVATNALGVASAPFTANGTVGSNYSVTAVAGALNGSFTLTNVAATPASVTANTGTTPQSTAINTAFPNALAVTVKDSGSNPLQGVGVTFTAPAAGASGTFSNGLTSIIVSSDASGTASAPFTANGTAGTNYSVTATAGALSATFTLTNSVPMAQVTFQTLPAGLNYTVDGTAYTSSKTISWVVGSSHTVSTVSTQPGSAGVQYVFTGWSDSGALSHSITAPAAATTYTASFNTQYLLSSSVSPPGSGSVAGGGTFYNAGSIAPISATPNANFGFANWTGNVASPGNASTTITMTGPQSVTANFALASLPPGYQYYRVITINHSQVSGSTSLSNFPVLISLALDASLAANAQANANDILFTDSSASSKLNHEIESYNAATGRLNAWVQIPSVSPTTDTVLLMFYGNPSAANQQSKTAVWDANFQGVWHLPNGTTLSAGDSTANANNGVISSAVATTGEIDGGASFSKASLDFGSSAGLHITGPITAEAWINVSGWPANGYPFGVFGMGHSYASLRTGWMLETSTDNSGKHFLNWFTNNGSTHGVATAVPSLATGSWHHFAGTFDGSTWRLYLDGAANGSSTDTIAPLNTGVDIVAGGMSTNGYGNIFPFNGLLDELRVSNTARSAAWIATEFNNQSSSANFLSVGPPQSGGGVGVPLFTVTTSPAGLSFQVDGTAYTALQTFQWNPGDTHTIAVTTSPQAGATGVQSVYTSWSDAGAQSHTITVPASSTNYTANFTTQYFLTTLAGTGGTISPASGWVNTGTSVSISASANSGYQFAGFTGAVSGTTTPRNLTVTAPASVTATFAPNSGGGITIATGQYDNTRTAANTQETILTPTNVSSGNFGLLGSFTGLDEFVYAQPLYIPGVIVNGAPHTCLIVVTMNNTVYCFDAHAPGTPALWSTNFEAPSTNSAGAFYNRVIGCVSTPVADIPNNLLYLTCTNSSNNWVLRAVNLSTGTVIRSVTIAGQVPGTGDPAGDHLSGPNLLFWGPGELQRPGLLLLNGTIYMGFGGTGGGDIHPWHGWIMGYDAASFNQTAIICLTPNSYGSAIWQSGGGLASDGTYIYVTTGNDNSGPYTESFLKLDQSLNIVDYFTPSNFGNLDSADLDLTSGKLMLIPGTTYLTGGGKDYRVWLLNTADMGHIQGTGTAPQVFYTNSSGPQGAGIYGGMFMNNVGYFPNAKGSIYAFPFSSTAYNTTPTKTSSSYAFPGADMSGSANGTNNGIVWAMTALNSAGHEVQTGTLRAFDATTLVELWDSDQNSANALGGFAKFVIPIVADGRVYATSTRSIQVYGLSSNPSTVSITVNTTPPGLAFQVDGTAYATAQTFQWNPGDSHTIAVTASTQAGANGVQNLYASWSDGGSQSHTITVPVSPTAYTASFTTQYFLTTSAGTGGTISPASEWLNSGTSVTISAAAASGYQFSSFSGSVTGTTNPVNLTVNAPATVSANFTTPSGGGGTNWYNGAWSYQKAITINHSQVSGAASLNNFPVLISLATDASLAANAQANGNDIVFTDSTGTNKLNHEIESYNPVTGRLVAWIQVPSISPTADTLIYMFYGNPSAANQQSKAAVWDASFQGVWHLPNGTALSAADSTANANNGVISSAVAIAGEIDGGASFSKASLDFGSSAKLQIAGPITAEAWINVSGWPASGYPSGIFGMGYSYATQRTGWMLETSTDSGGKHYMNWFTNNGGTHGVATAVPSIATGTWHHLAGTFDGATWRMYLDGAANGASTDATPPLNTAVDVVAGGLSTNGYGNIFPFNGILDELRVSNVARSAAWIATEFNNQANFGNFLSVGPAQSGGGGTPSFTVTTSPAGLSFQVDGTTYTALQTFQWTPGNTHTIAVTTSPQPGVTGVQNLYASWSDAGAQSHTITVPASSTNYTANFTTQYFLTTSAGTGGTISPPSGWVNAGTSVSIGASANSGYQFASFTGAISGTTTPVNFTVNAPASVAASFTPSGGGTVSFTVTSSPPGLGFQVDGVGYTAAQIFQWTPGDSHTLAVTTSPQAGATGVQNVYSSWSDTGAQSHTITVPAATTTYTASFTTQYFLTTSAGAGGTISPPSGWVNGGASVSISATANSGYQFSGFTGAVAGTTTPVNFTVNAPASVAANFTVSSGGGSSWYNNAWAYQQPITINHALVSGGSGLTNFPVLISMATNATLAANAQSNGNDIVFTDSSGTVKINHEIERYNPATGQLVAWVQVPSISPTSDTVIYMYFGNPSAGNQQSKTAVWDGNYKGVWHLPDGATLSGADSTASANNGTISAAVATNGEIDGGASFGGSASMDFGAAAGLQITGPITAEAWINVAAWPANGYPSGVFGMGYTYASQRTGWMLETSTDNSGKHFLNWFSNNGSTHGVAMAVPSLTTGTWHHLAGTFDGATWRMYLDGAASGSSADATAPLNTGVDVVAGGLSTNGYGNIFPFKGLLDELRVSNTARSAGWLATEFTNQSNPGGFLIVGAPSTHP